MRDVFGVLGPQGFSHPLSLRPGPTSVHRMDTVMTRLRWDLGPYIADNPIVIVLGPCHQLVGSVLRGLERECRWPSSAPCRQLGVPCNDVRRLPKEAMFRSWSVVSGASCWVWLLMYSCSSLSGWHFCYSLECLFYFDQLHKRIGSAVWALFIKAG